MDCSTPGLPVHHQLLEFTQNHVYWVGDAIQPFDPLSSPLSLPSIILIHVEVWQKRKFCKAIIFQLKNKLIKKKKEEEEEDDDLSCTPSVSAGPGCEERKDSVGTD